MKGVGAMLAGYVAAMNMDPPRRERDLIELGDSRHALGFVEDTLLAVHKDGQLRGRGKGGLNVRTKTRTDRSKVKAARKQRLKGKRS